MAKKQTKTQLYLYSLSPYPGLSSLFLAVLGRHFCTGFSLVAAHKPVFLVQQRFYGVWASGAAVHGLRNCGAWTQELRLPPLEHRLSSCVFLTQGSNPHLLSPALQVDYLPTEPPGKPRVDYGKFQNEEIGSWCLLLHFSVLCSHPPLRYFPMVEQHKEIDILQFAGWGLLDLNLESINY